MRRVCSHGIFTRGGFKNRTCVAAYWFVKNNELIGSTEVFSGDVIKSLVINAAVIIGFTIVFFVGSNIVTKKKMKAE